MRNVDRIKALEQELGRTRRRLADKEKKLEEAMAGNRQTQAAVDALFTAAVLAWGQEEAGGTSRRLELPAFSVEEMGRRYTLQVRREGAGYILQAGERKACEER